MRLLDYTIPLNKASDRVEIYPIGDVHLGKRNCAEKMLKEEVREILRRARLKDRQVRVLLGGDIMNQVIPRDVKRFDFHDMADWLVQGASSEEVRQKLSDLPLVEERYAVDFFKPLQPYIIGAISGNHEDYIRKAYHVDVQERFCHDLGIPNLTDEAVIRLRFRTKTKGKGASTLLLYLRHGYGGGRGAGAEPRKLADMLADWDSMDVCLTGHTHSPCIAPPKPSLFAPTRGSLPDQLLLRYRWAANWGCWLYSHQAGEASYESRACYPARPVVTCKVVVWPYFHLGTREVPKVEIRSYPIMRKPKSNDTT